MLPTVTLPSSPSPPVRFGRYELLETLGEGGMGVVRLAHERGAPGGDRLVALKQVKAQSNDRLLRGLFHEAGMMARLRHDNVVRIFRLGEQDGTFFLAMEHIEGASLQEWIIAAGQRRPIPLGAVLGAMAQACRGAHAAHTLIDDDGQVAGLVHRDITPHNIMVDRHGRVVLLDFGIAAVVDSNGVAINANNMAGKRPWLSPEQAAAAPLDRLSDVFTLGTVLWELLARRRRFDRVGEAVLLQIVLGEGPAIEDVVPTLPSAVGALVATATATAKEDRFPSAAAFADAIDDVANELGLDTSRTAIADAAAAAMGRTIAQRLRVVLDVERTMLIMRDGPAAPALPGGTEARTVADDTIVKEVPPNPHTVAQQGGGSAPRAIPLDAGDEVIASGPNFEVTASGPVAHVRVWSRPDLNRDEGAEAGRLLMGHVLALYLRHDLKGLIVDASAARMVLGGRTIEALERMFGGAEDHDVALAVIVSRDPLQQLDFTDLIARVAPNKGRVFVDVLDAAHFLRRQARNI